MKAFPFLFLALACSASLPGADSDEPNGTTFPLEQTFSLNLQEIARLDGEEIGFRFDSVVTDSRCPPDVNCIWAGEVTVAIRWLQPETIENVHLSLSPRDKPSESRQGNVVLRLMNVLPYPGTAQGKTPEASRATFRFERSPSED